MMESNQNTALLIMDMQPSIVGRLPNSGEIVGKAAQAIAYARANSIPVIYVIVGFRAGAPEISPSNKGFVAIGKKENWTPEKVEEWMRIHPGVTPQDDEIVVTKRRISAFTGSDLEVVLRAQGIQHLVLSGVSTSGVGLSTTREASDKDYKITVLSDACGDADEEVHRVLTSKVFPRQADVVTVEDWSK